LLFDSNCLFLKIENLNPFKSKLIYDKKPAVTNFVSQLGLTMPSLSDEYNFAGTKHSLTGVPEPFIVDKQGIIREKFIGPAEWDSPENLDMLTKYINE
jgi:cytochrome c biogenesis protein CcmG/thiol:disulfide interchange protein DsbE